MLTTHNLHFYLTMMRGVRDALSAGDTDALGASAEALFLRGIEAKNEGRP
mgnify:CR=1 FL=1